MNMVQGRQRDLGWMRYIGWGAAVALILLPLAAMQFALESGVNWTLSDFIFAGVLLGTAGLLIELAVRASKNWPQRLAALLAVGTGFLLVWSNLAVGYFGDGSSPLNDVLLALPLFTLVAALILRMRPRPTAALLAATAVAHGMTGVLGYAEDPVTGPITAAFVMMWLLAAWLFHHGSR